MRKQHFSISVIDYCDICGEQCGSGYLQVEANGRYYHGCSTWDETAQETHADQLKKLAGAGNYPEQIPPAGPEAGAILDAFKAQGMLIEPGASYSVRGQIAQLLNGIAVLISPAGIRSGQKGE